MLVSMSYEGQMMKRRLKHIQHIMKMIVIMLMKSAIMKVMMKLRKFFLMDKLMMKSVQSPRPHSI